MTPIDAETTLYYAFSVFRRRGPLRTFLDRVFWILWLSWVHDWLFSDQDKRVLEAVVPGQELPSRTDIGVVAWRRFAVAHARRPPPRERDEAAAAEKVLQRPAAE